MTARDPFKIDGPTCISFSGGRTSAYMLWRVLQSNGGLPADAVVCFANTGKEEEATLRFVRDCSERWGVPIRWVEWEKDGYVEVTFDTASRDGEPFAALIRHRAYLPNPVTRFCTSELKIRTMHPAPQASGAEPDRRETAARRVVGQHGGNGKQAGRRAVPQRPPELRRHAAQRPGSNRLHRARRRGRHRVLLRGLIMTDYTDLIARLSGGAWNLNTLLEVRQAAAAALKAQAARIAALESALQPFTKHCSSDEFISLRVPTSAVRAARDALRGS